MSERNPSKRIVILTHEFFPKRGGIAVYTEEMARAAVEMGYSVEVWAPDSQALREADFPFKVEYLPVKGSLNWTCRWKLIQFLKIHRERINGNILYLPEPGPIFTMLYLQLFGTLSPSKILLTLHGSEIKRFTRFPHRKYLFSRLLQNSDRIGVVSEFNRALLSNTFPQAPFLSKVEIVSGGLRTDFKPMDRKPPSDGLLRILTTGRVHPRKGQHAVIEAIAQLPESLRSKTLYNIVGPPVSTAYQRRLETKAKALAVRVNFLGQVPDASLNQAYAEADLFAMTSIPHGQSIEGFGLVYLEASAMGLPIVAHRTGGVPEAVAHENTGLLVEPDNREALAAAIETLLTQKKLAAELGENGKSWAYKRSWRANLESLLTKN